MKKKKKKRILKTKNRPRKKLNKRPKKNGGKKRPAKKKETKRSVKRPAQKRKRKRSPRRKAAKRIKKIKTRAQGGNKVYYGLNPRFRFLKELRSLMLVSPPASFVRMEKKIAALGRIKLALVSGVFLNKENVADLLIVGDDIDRRRFKSFLKALEAEVGTQIIYAIMDREEFHYRRAMFDRFVRLMTEGPHEILIDKVGL